MKNFGKLIEAINCRFHGVDHCIYVSGSVVEGERCPMSKGMGNPNSDVDVFVIAMNRDGISDCEEQNKSVLFLRIDDVFYDIEIFTISFYQNISNEIRQMDFSSEKRVFNMMKLQDFGGIEELNGILNRFFYSQCIYNNELYSSLYNSIDFIKFQQYYMIYIRNDIDIYIDDAKGNLMVNQEEVSFYCLRMATINYMKYVIYKYGEMVDRDKWVFIKFNNIVKNYSLEGELHIEKILNHLLYYSLKKDKDNSSEINKMFDELGYLLNFIELEELSI